MRQFNFLGVAKNIYPAPFTSFTSRSNTFATNLYFMSGVMPSKDELNSIVTEARITSNYTSNIIHKLSFSMSVYYNDPSKTTTFIKTIVDATTVPFLTDGPITWAILVFTNATVGTNKYMLFFDEDATGLWGEANKIAVVDTLVGTTGDTNIFKDMKFSVSDQFSVVGV